MSLITTNDNRIVLKKAESMMVVPYVYDSNVGDYVLGGDIYDISSIIGNSITLELSDGETTTKMNEFKSSPLLVAHYGGKYNLSAQCLDLQNTVLYSLFGAMEYGNNAAAFSDDFVGLYALIRIRFTENSLPDVYLPKVQIDSKLFINQLKTRASQGNITGVSFASFVIIPSRSKTSSFNNISGDMTDRPYTPLLFVKKSIDPLFYHHKMNFLTDVYSTVNFNNGNVLANAHVDQRGSITYITPI